MAGLLDFLMPDQAGSGLLDFLRHNAMAQQFQSGLPSDQAQYGQPQLAPATGTASPQPSGWGGTWPQDNMAWPQGPIGAPSSVNAQARMPAPQQGTYTQGPQGAPVAPTAPPAMASASAPQLGGAGGPISGFLGRAGDALMSIPRGGAPDPAVAAAQTANLTARALIQKGIPQDVAIAAVQPGNGALLSELFKQVAGQGTFTQEVDKDGNVWNVNRLTGQKTVALQAKDDRFQNVTVKNPDGTETIRPFNNKTGEYGNPPAPLPGQQAAPTPISMDDLKKNEPALAAQVQAVIDGRVPLPTGARVNPQQQRVREAVLQIDPTFDSNVSRTRQKFQMEYGSTAPNSVGGQKILMGTALGHLGELAESSVKMGNGSGMGLAPLGHFSNRIGNLTTANSANAVALEDKAAKFSGEVGKLYSGSQGGGVHEREETRSRFSPNNTPEEMAAALEASRDLILSKQRALEAQAESIYGPEGAQKFDFVGPEGRDALNKIEEAIVRLRGGKSGAASNAAPPSPGAYSWSPDKGLQPK